MNDYGKQINTMEKQGRGLNRYSVLHDSWRSLDGQTTPLKYEAKEYHQWTKQKTKVLQVPTN